MDSAQLETFAAVVREGSFDAAARVLNVTPSAVSQRIKALEQAAGQVLVRRARPCQATEAGAPLLRLAGQIALLEREALDTARGSGAGTWTRAAVVVNADSLATWFMPALAAVPPELRLLFDIHQDDQEHTADLLRSGTVMAAVTAQNVPVQGCRSQRLGAMGYRAVAAPAMFATWFADGVTPRALADAPMLVVNRKDRLQHRFLRTLTRRELDPPSHYVPSVTAFEEAIRLGLGWGMVPDLVADADLAAGRYRELSPGSRLTVPLYWQHWRFDAQALTALTEAVRTVAAATLR
ncbi:LysR family transcriptional regulator ArgP [Catellatospora methionotrophica]|uniref:LysR family transcriptional regulator ArgP n=1 Tax=Catellatospora methionotrophica TaxID=121620 RepID=UPI0019412B4B|nr:LysR family transcriptional regulator ArgP [Catellatospora methionotrophica]